MSSRHSGCLFRVLTFYNVLLSIPMTCMFLSLIITINTAILVEWICIFLPDGGNQRPLFFWTCHFIIWANIVYFTVAVILANLSCVPHEYLWNRTIMGGYCRVNTAHLAIATACLAFAIDTIVLFIPQRIIWTLNTSQRRKLGVSIVFTLGMAACVASIVRLYVTVLKSTSADLTYHSPMVQLTVVVEGARGILVLCVPAMPKAVSGMKRKGSMASRLSRARRQTTWPDGCVGRLVRIILTATIRTRTTVCLGTLDLAWTVVRCLTSTRTAWDWAIPPMVRSTRLGAAS